MNKTLSNGQEIPMLGLGTWQVTGDAVGAVVEAAINAGVRHIDCAMIYGNEAEIGVALKRVFDQGVVTRDDLFITGKLWNTDHAPEGVLRACQKSIDDLGVEYLDLYLVHWGVGFVNGEGMEPLDENGLAKFSNVPLYETWRAMESLVSDDVVKGIGVANYTAPMIVDLLAYATVKPVMNQVEVNPYFSQESLIHFCQSQDMMVTAYSPFGSTGAPVRDNVLIAKLAEKYDADPVKVIVQWAIQRDLCIIPRTSSAEHATTNAVLPTFELTVDELQQITDLDRGVRYCDPVGWWGFPYFS